MERLTVTGCWTVGHDMDAFLRGTRKWGSDIVLARQLSGDIAIDTRTLQQSLQFFRAYPRVDSGLPISWSYYRVLMSIGSPARRRQWERRTVREGISFKDFLGRLQEERESRLPAVNKSKSLPVPVRGRLYHYRLLKVDYVNDASDGVMLDCGFSNRIVPPPGGGRLVNKRVVRADKTGGRYRVVISGETAASLFTYQAFVERVVDGETMVVNVDEGFGLWTRQYLRLAGIDAPEIATVAGRRVKAWLEKELAACPFVIIKTSKSDKYDRYLADVFYTAADGNPHCVAGQGAYLNQRLLDERLAKSWVP